MRTTWAIARLTFWEGVRMRIVLVFLILLAFIVLRLPFALRGDETLSGRLQTFISYSLGALSVLMGLATVFFSCATLTNEIHSRTLHLVVSKPVHRFSILAGKWIGVNLLNVLMVLLAGLVIYGLAAFIKSRPVQFERDRVKLDEVVWTARLAADPTPPNLDSAVAQRVKAMLEQGRIDESQQEAAAKEVRRELEQEWVRVPPGQAREYVFDGLAPPDMRQDVYQVRFKARGIPYPIDEMLEIGWVILDPKTGAPVDEFRTHERHGEVHQFLVRSTIVKDGRAVLGVYNPSGPPKPVTIYFEGDESLQILYRVGNFEPNLAKSMLMILFRLAFLSAVGLFFGTFVSFPVACFCVLSVYLFCLGMPWWMEAVQSHLTIAGSQPKSATIFDPLLRVVKVLMAALFPDFQAYDGVSRLIDGIYIPTRAVLVSAAHTILYGVALLALPGWMIFRSREIAQAAA